MQDQGHMKIQPTLKSMYTNGYKYKQKQSSLVCSYKLFSWKTSYYGKLSGNCELHQLVITNIGVVLILELLYYLKAFNIFFASFISHSQIQELRPKLAFYNISNFHIDGQVGDTPVSQK